MESMKCRKCAKPINLHESTYLTILLFRSYCLLKSLRYYVISFMNIFPINGINLNWIWCNQLPDSYCSYPFQMVRYLLQNFLEEQGLKTEWTIFEQHREIFFCTCFSNFSIDSYLSPFVIYVQLFVAFFAFSFR